MRSCKVVRLNAVTYPVDPDERSQLEQIGAQFSAIEGQQPDEIIAAASNCDALLVVSAKIPQSVVAKLPSCRVIARLGAGTDRIDVTAATHHGILVTNVPDFCLHEQAEHTLALLLAFARRLPHMMAAMRRGDWSARHHPGVHRLAGQTLGLVGFGASAQAVARRAAAFDLRLVAWARNPGKYREHAASLHVELRDLDGLLAQSDFVSIHLPLTDGTQHLLDRRRIRLMKPNAVLINTARGAIVDETALVGALKSKLIAGAALDVFHGIDVFALPGQLTQHALLDLDNVILTPHCAGSSVESTRESKIRGTANAVDVLLGRWPKFIVNPQVVPRFPLEDAQ
jgi:D-3-phosphoglycerate dehydrogenase / 2-oxoglutarate reductase